MFSWKPIYQEIAQRIMDFEERQIDLIELLNEMERTGLNVIRRVDHPTKDTRGTLSEIDPFTFFAAFNRGTTAKKRVQVCEFLKTAWKLHSELPKDFRGIPILNPQASWFIPYAFERSSDDVPNLWKLARVAVEGDWEECSPELFETCLNISKVGVAKLTTGLFWLSPERFLPLPKTTIRYGSRLAWRIR